MVHRFAVYPYYGCEKSIIKMFSQRYLYNVDWLGVTMRLRGDIQPIRGYVWQEYTATNVWAKRRVLYTDDGDKVLTLLSEPRSPQIKADLGLCEIANEWLYHGIGFDGILGVLSKSQLWDFVGISRLDLCCDFSPTPSQKQIILGLASGEYYVGSKQNGSGFWSTNSNPKLARTWLGAPIPHCQSWGHKTSEIKWKLYYKTKELYDAGGGKFLTKPYIADAWRIHGLDESNVWRLEVSMKHLNNYAVYGQQIDLDYIRDFGDELFVRMYNQRFKVKLNEGHKDRSNDKEVSFLDMPKLVRAFERLEPSSHRERNGRITLLRHLVNSLDDEQVLFDKYSRDAVFNHIYSILERDNLHGYFSAMTGMVFEEFVASKDEAAQGMMPALLSRQQKNYDIKPNLDADVAQIPIPIVSHFVDSRKVDTQFSLQFHLEK